MSTFTPQPGAAPLRRQVAAQTSMEARLLLRNGEQLLLALVIPVLVLVGAVLGAERLGLDLAHPAVDEFTPGVLALAVLSSSFTSLAIMTGFERRYGVLKRLGASPLPRSGLLLGKVGALAVVEVVQAAVIGGVALVLGWRPLTDGIPLALLVALLATFAFAALGLLLAGVLRAEATLAAANLFYLLLLAGGGVVLPSSSYGAASGVVSWLPSAALGDGMRAALLDGTVPGRELLVLLLWGGAAAALTARTFRWE